MSRPTCPRAIRRVKMVPTADGGTRVIGTVQRPCGEPLRYRAWEVRPEHAAPSYYGEWVCERHGPQGPR